MYILLEYWSSKEDNFPGFQDAVGKRFDSITPPTTEQKQTALERVNLEGVFYEQSSKTVNGFAHIGIAASNVDFLWF